MTLGNDEIRMTNGRMKRNDETRMTNGRPKRNDEARMTNDESNSNDEIQMTKQMLPRRGPRFVIRSGRGQSPIPLPFVYSSLIRHSNFVIRHFLTIALISGCTSNRPTSPALVQSPVYAVPAQQLVQQVRQIVTSSPISLPVEDQGDGTLLTGWQEPFKGDFHIVRFWHERTRYRIHIIPAFSDPAHQSRIQIVDESEQRPDESGPNEEAKTWHSAPNNHRPERAEALLHQIEAKLEAPAATRASS